MRTSLPRIIYNWFSYVLMGAHDTFPARTVKAFRYV